MNVPCVAKMNADGCAQINIAGISNMNTSGNQQMNYAGMTKMNTADVTKMQSSGITATNTTGVAKMNSSDGTKVLMRHSMLPHWMYQLLKTSPHQANTLTTPVQFKNLDSLKLWKKIVLHHSQALVLLQAIVLLLVCGVWSAKVCAAPQQPLYAASQQPLNAVNQDVSFAFPLQVSLDETDLKILKALSEGKGKKLSSKPVVNAPDQVSFIYGASRPTLVCSLLHVCDIALEPGENVVDLKAGDSARWIIERSASGSPQGIIEHIAVKPTDTGLTSNLRIYTDRRTYYLDLKSTPSEFMPSIKFVYPENSLRKYAQIKAQLQQQQSQIARNMVQAGERSFNLSELNFAYKLQGDKQLRPLRVFNDHRKTYIQMPPEVMQQGRMPALVAVHESGGLFSDDKTAIINYRIQDNSFVVDGLYPHLRLILGQQSSHALSADIELMES